MVPRSPGLLRENGCGLTAPTSRTARGKPADPPRSPRPTRPDASFAHGETARLPAARAAAPRAAAPRAAAPRARRRAPRRSPRALWTELVPWSTPSACERLLHDDVRHALIEEDAADAGEAAVPVEGLRRELRVDRQLREAAHPRDRKSTRLNS